MRIRIQVLLLEPSSLLMILRGELAVRFHCSSDVSVIGLCGYIYKKFMVVVSADAKVRVYIKPSSQRGGREHKNACFILRRGARIMENQHSIMIFKVFFAFTITAAAISRLISLSPDSSKATNAAASFRFHCSSDASVIGLCGYIYKKFMVVVSADAKGYRGIAFLDSFFILFAPYTEIYAGARIMEKQHSIMIFKVFFAFTIAAATISHSILLSPDSSKATNAAASSKIASEEERKMCINGEPSDLR
ncbi:hypothetical protein DY000_02018317 [Brassica cretica]|uniref:CASP-like protein n=1 Tax=Brassica cretica TaxID=69181 RepID=A0ABQ7CY11_BRACR|nr:hypothetical protein DY000_02018317 [Brassica cretica]